jgi:hypothetical protein
MSDVAVTKAEKLAAEMKAEKLRAIREFFVNDDLMEVFVDEMQTRNQAWSSVIDHAGRLVLVTPNRGQVFTIQPGENGFDCVEFADPALAFDPEAELSKKDHSLAWIHGQGDTPQEAFKVFANFFGLTPDGPRLG